MRPLWLGLVSKARCQPTMHATLSRTDHAAQCRSDFERLPSARAETPDLIRGATTLATHLYGRAGDIPVRAKHAAVTRLGLKTSPTVRTGMEIHAGIFGHFQFFGVPAFGTRQFGYDDVAVFRHTGLGHGNDPFRFRPESYAQGGARRKCARGNAALPDHRRNRC